MPSCMSCGRYSLLGLSLYQGLCAKCFKVLSAEFTTHRSSLEECNRVYEETDSTDIKVSMLEQIITHGEAIRDIFLRSKLGDYDWARRNVEALKTDLVKVRQELAKMRFEEWTAIPKEIIKERLPVFAPPTTIKTIEMPYERDCQNKPKSRVITVDGDERLMIEELAIRRFSEMGYVGFHGENRFWEVFASLLFYGDILIESRGRVCLPFPGKLVERLSLEMYMERLESLRDNNELKSQIQGAKNHYMSMPLLHELEEKRRNSERFRNTLIWSDVLVESLERCTLLRIVDWVVTGFRGEVKGMPDLILYKDNRVSFAEVKSERDIISKAQADTLDFLTSELGLEVFLMEGIEIGES